MGCDARQRFLRDRRDPHNHAPPPHTHTHTPRQDDEVDCVKIMWCEWGNDRSHLEPPAHVAVRSVVYVDDLVDFTPASQKPKAQASKQPGKAQAAEAPAAVAALSSVDQLPVSAVAVAAAVVVAAGDGRQRRPRRPHTQAPGPGAGRCMVQGPRSIGIVCPREVERSTALVVKCREGEAAVSAQPANACMHCRGGGGAVLPR